MNSLKLSQDKYGKELAIIFINDDTSLRADISRCYIALIVVDAKDRKAADAFKRVVRTLPMNKVFTIAVFITGKYDWTYDNVLMFGINAWLLATSIEEANDIVSSIQRITDISDLTSIDLTDIKTILYKGNGGKAYYASGENSDGNVKAALSEAVKNGNDKGYSIYEYNKVLLAISYNSNLTNHQMRGVEEFVNLLSERHKGDFQFKWGLIPSRDINENNLKVTLVASR